MVGGCTASFIAESTLTSERDHPLDQLEQLQSRAMEFVAAGDLDSLVECRIKQCFLQRILVELHNFPRSDLVESELVLAEAYAEAGYHYQAEEHLRVADEESCGVLEEAQRHRLAVRLLLAQGQLSRARGSEDDACRLLNDACRLGRQIFGELDARQAHAERLLGELAVQRGDHADATNHFSTAWRVHEKLQGADAEVTLRLRLLVAAELWAGGQTDEALRLQVVIAERLLKRASLPILAAEAMTQLARWLERRGQDMEALEKFNAAERLMVDNIGLDGQKAIDIKSDLALLHLKMENHAAALRYLKDVHYYERRLHGPQSAGVARALKALGTIHYSTRDFPEAEHCFLQALRIFEQESDSEDHVQDIHDKLDSMDVFLCEETSSLHRA